MKAPRSHLVPITSNASSVFVLKNHILGNANFLKPLPYLQSNSPKVQRPQSRGMLDFSVPISNVTETWQLAVLPRAPQYWCATPAECVPFLGKDTSSDDPIGFRHKLSLHFPRQRTPDLLMRPGTLVYKLLQRLNVSIRYACRGELYRFAFPIHEKSTNVHLSVSPPFPNVPWPLQGRPKDRQLLLRTAQSP